MKAIIKILVGACIISFSTSCNKEENLNIELKNYDTFEPGEIDDWITKSLTDPYNIEVIYRYQRNMHDIEKNISPPDESRVIPQMDVVIKGFLDIYKSVGGVPFIKNYTPKQFALFGSGDYDVDGSVKGGTADGGRRITLYGLNNFSVSNPNAVKGNLQVIHHEFTHILNQNRFIPADFGKICAGDYLSNWTSSENTTSVARSLGFISAYSRKAVGEDFAEVLSQLIVEGQLFYENAAFNAGQSAYTKLKAKEAIVRDYMMQNFNIDVSHLQMEFHRLMEVEYKSTNYAAFNALSRNFIASLDWDIRKSWGIQNNISAKQNVLFMKILDGIGGFETKTMIFKFESASKATLQISFGDASNTFNAFYDFTLTRNNDNTYSFVKSATQGTGNNYSNGNVEWVLADTKPLIDYLESTKFNVVWKNADFKVNPDDYLKYILFNEVTNGNNSLLGNVVLKRF